MHSRATPIFNGQNCFHFPWATSASTQLESFLVTIGPVNVGHLRNISIHVPLWYRGIHEDFVEGAILDLTSPASRLGVVQPAATDRLLSAIRSSVQALLKAGMLQHLSLDLEHGMVTDRWTGRYSSDRQLIATPDAQEHVVRKRQGVELLGKLGELESLRIEPQLSLHHPILSIAKYDLSEFRSRLAVPYGKLRSMDGRSSSISRVGAGRSQQGNQMRQDYCAHMGGRVLRARQSTVVDWIGLDFAQEVQVAVFAGRQVRGTIVTDSVLVEPQNPCGLTSPAVHCILTRTLHFLLYFLLHLLL